MADIELVGHAHAAVELDGFLADVTAGIRDLDLGRGDHPAALVGLAACTTTPPSRFYTLSSLPAAGPPPAGAATQILLIGTVELPQTLDRPQFVTRSGANKVDVAELDRWSEPLDGMVRRILAADLTARLGGYRILTATLPSVPIDATLML